MNELCDSQKEFVLAPEFVTGVGGDRSLLIGYTSLWEPAHCLDLIQVHSSTNKQLH